MKRRRSRQAVVIFIVIALGLATLKYRPLSPHILGAVGDALWALGAFLGFGFLFPCSSTKRTVLLAGAFAAAIECSQLYHAPWIDELRRTLFGRLVLGTTFNWGDFLSYAVGIAMGGIGELRINSRTKERATSN